MTDLPPTPEQTPPVEPPAYAQQPTPGYAAPYPTGYAAPARTNTLAIVSLILSIAGLFVPLASIAGIVTGHISLGQIKRTGEAGHGLAFGGTVVGYIVTGLGLIAIVAYVIFLVVIIGAGVAGTSMNY